MADRYPLVINPNANQIQEIPSGDTLDLTGNNINGAGIITATKFVGPMEGTVTGNISGSSGGLSGTPSIIVNDITAATGTFTGNVSIAGTLTYEDVKNVDSVGLITARNGLAVTGGTATFSGAVDANQGIDVDGQTTLDNVNVSGVVTATRFIGDLDAPGLDTNSNGIVVTGVATATSFSGPLTGNLSGNIIGTRTLGTGVTVTAAGVVSATTYYGDGSNLTNITSTTINNNANNRIITGSGTANTLEGESTLTYNGSLLNITGDVALPTTNRIYFGNSDTSFIKGEHGASSHLAFGANNEKMRLTRNGTLGIGTTNPVSTTQLHVNKSWNNSTATTSSAVNLLVSNNASAGDWSVLGFQAGNTGGSAIYFGDTDSTNAGFFDYYHSDNKLVYGSGGATRLQIGAAGTVTPGADNTQDLGAPNARWANVYTGDLHLSNSGAGNSVDGTSGSWTMQEGESDLFLINNNTGKKYKFNLTEVS